MEVTHPAWQSFARRKSRAEARVPGHPVESVTASVRLVRWPVDLREVAHQRLMERAKPFGEEVNAVRAMPAIEQLIADQRECVINIGVGWAFGHGRKMSDRASSIPVPRRASNGSTRQLHRQQMAVVSADVTGDTTYPHVVPRLSP